MKETRIFSATDHLAATAEGWGIFAVDGDDTELQLQRLDESDTFRSDDEAWEFVITKAVSGSGLHQRAIAYIKQTSPDEFERFVKDAAIGDNDGSPILLFHNGEGVGFQSVATAEKALAHYRSSVSLT